MNLHEVMCTLSTMTMLKCKHIIRHELVRKKIIFPLQNFVQSQKGMSNYFRFSVTHSLIQLCELRGEYSVPK